MAIFLDENGALTDRFLEAIKLDLPLDNFFPDIISSQLYGDREISGTHDTDNKRIHHRIEENPSKKFSNSAGNIPSQSSQLESLPSEPLIATAKVYIAKDHDLMDKHSHSKHVMEYPQLFENTQSSFHTLGEGTEL